MKQKLKNLNICVIGYNNVLGKLFVKKLSSFFDINPDQLIYFVQVSKHSKKQKFSNDSYFDNTDKQFIKNHIIFINPTDLHKQLNKIDILYNFFIPLDFSQFDKAMQYHIIRTNQICSSLSTIPINKLIMISSVYCQNPGFVAEGQKLQEYFITAPKDINKKQVLDLFIRETFSSYRECWQWSIKNIEKQYSKLKIQSMEIVRAPSLGPTLNNYEGYSDKFNYFTYFLYLMGTGFFSTINGVPENITDLIPADYLFNYLAVLSVRQQSPRFRVHNLSTSSRNPISIQKLFSYFVQSWQQYQKNLSKKPKIIHKKWQQSLDKIRQNLPIKVKSRLSNIFDLKKWKIQSQQQTIALQKKNTLAAKYQYFLQNQWICQSNYSIDLFSELENMEKNYFHFNVNSINWKIYAKLCCYSIKKYLLQQNIEIFDTASTDLLLMQHGTGHSYFSDILWALNQGKVVNATNHIEIKNYILTTKSVKQAIKTLVEQRMLKLQNDPISYEKAQQQLYKAADEMCTQMFSQYNMKSIRVFAWFLHKIFKTIYEKVVVDTNALMKHRNHNEKENGPLIIIPTHRSYVDFLIMGYVFFGFGIKLPHIAAAEDFLNMAVVHILLRQSGAFFIKRNQQKNKQLYKAIMEEYISKVLEDSHYLEFFIEGTRCRVGKMLPPKFGILSIVAKNVLQGRIPDATILPITVNYQKILQGQSFTYQMMGQSKVKQSLSRLLKAVDTLKQNYGRIYLQFCQPISVKKFFHHHESQGLKYNQTLQKLGFQIVHSLSDKLLITAPAVLATVVLMHRKGISDDALSQNVMWLCKQITSRGIKIARSQSDSSISISNTLTLLSDIVSKSKKNMFEVQVSLEQQSFIKLFLMTFYRNNLTHIFWEESLVMLSLMSFGHQKINQKGLVSIDQLFDATKFVYQLLIRQYVLRYSLNDKNRFMKVLELMESKGVVQTDNNYVFLGPQGEPNSNYFSFYGSLSWPIIQSYWITCLYFFKLKNQKPIPIQKFLSQIQWFAQSLINQRIITHHESISIDTIKNAVDTFVQMKVIKKFNQQYKDGSKVSSVILNADQNSLKKLQEKLEVYLKKSYAKSVKGILQSGQGSVNLDFPFLSKL